MFIKGEIVKDIIYSLKTEWTPYSLKLNPHHPRVLCTKFLSFLRRWLLKFVNIFLLFHYYLPLKKGGAIHLNKLESSSPKNALCQVSLNLALWLLRRKFLKFVNIFLLFRYYLPLEKGVALHLNKLESPSPKDALCQVWMKLTQWFLRGRFFNFVNVFLLFRYYLP